MSLRIVADDRLIPMTRLHHEGVFEALLPDATREALDYRLRVTWPDGSEVEIDDPYRYGPVLTDFDQHLFAEGTHVRAFERLGARPITHGIRAGVHFAVWAPNAQRVSVVGDFNGWDGRVHPMRALVPSGLWEIFVPDLGAGDRYKFEVLDADGTSSCSRPIRAAATSRCRRRPRRSSGTASGYEWQDDDWMARARRARAVAARSRCRSTKCISAAGSAAPRGTPADLSRAGRDARALRARTWASRTSSCCR